MKNMCDINESKNRTEIKKTLKVTKINLTNETIDEMKDLFTQGVFQPFVEISLKEITVTEMYRLIIIHFMNIIGTQKSSTTKFKVNIKNSERYVSVYIKNIPETINTNAIHLEAYVNKPNDKGMLDPINADINMDLIDGIQKLLSDDMELILTTFCNTIQEYLTLNESPEEKEFIDAVYRSIMAENSKFIAMRNIDSSYTTRVVKDRYFFNGVGVNLKFEMYPNGLPVTTLEFNQGSLITSTNVTGRLTLYTIKHLIREVYSDFIKEGGKLNE